MSVEFLGADWSFEFEREIAELEEMDLTGFEDTRGLLVLEDWVRRMFDRIWLLAILTGLVWVVLMARERFGLFNWFLWTTVQILELDRP